MPFGYDESKGSESDSSCLETDAPIRFLAALLELGMRRRIFLGCMASSIPWAYSAQGTKANVSSAELPPSQRGESIPNYLQRVRGKWDQETYRKILGAANEFKEGDALIGVAAASDDERRTARTLLANTSIGTLRSHPPFEDELYRWMEKQLRENEDAPKDDMTLGQLRHQLLHEDPRAIPKAMSSWNSDIIACLVKILSNDDLIRSANRSSIRCRGVVLEQRDILGLAFNPIPQPITLTTSAGRFSMRLPME